MMKCILFILITVSLTFSTVPSCHKKETNNSSSLLSYYFDNREIDYINENNININEIIPYIEFESFNTYNFFEYENLRKEKNYTYIQTLNRINYPNFYKKYVSVKPAIFTNSFLTLVNKGHYVDSSFIPNDIIALKNTNITYIKRENEIMQANKTILENYSLLEQAAKKENFNLYVFSAYRSFDKQRYIYYDINNCNDETVARPGFSEHQLGLSLDISTLEYGLTNYLKDSEEYNWLIKNAHKYGFILRYPQGKEEYTGYAYEPWHFRYVGKDVASFIYENNLTLEEYIYDYLEIK